MSETLTGRGLSPQMRERIAAQRQEIEAQTVNELKQLSLRCQESAKNELHTIESVMAQGSAAVRRRFARLWLWIAGLGVVLILSLSLGSWGIGVWVTSSLQSYREERDALKREIADQQATVRQLEQQTWGVGYLETETGTFITWPGHHEQPYRSTNGKWAARLSRK